MQSKVWRRFLLAGALTAAATSITEAQTATASTTRSYSNGLMLGLSLNGASLKTEGNSGYDVGPGAGLSLGWGFNDKLTLFLDVDGSSMTPNGGGDAYGFGQADLGLRVHFNTGPDRVVPYIEGALTGRSAQQSIYANGRTTNIEIRGNAYTLGGGLMAYITPRTAMNIALLWTSGNFTEGRIDGTAVPGFGSINANGARFRIGLTFWPTAK
jgi:hypothetical protein